MKKEKKRRILLSVILISAAAVLLILLVFLPAQRKGKTVSAVPSGSTSAAVSSAASSESPAASAVPDSSSAADTSSGSGSDASSDRSVGGKSYHTCWVAGGQGVFPFALPKPVTLESGTAASKTMDIDSDEQLEQIILTLDGTPEPDETGNSSGDFYGTQLYQFSVGIAVNEKSGAAWNTSSEITFPVSWFDMDNARVDFFVSSDNRIYIEEYIDENFIEDGCRWRLQAYSYSGGALKQILLDRDSPEYGTVLACGNDGCFSSLGDMNALKAYSDENYKDFEQAAGKSEGFYDKLADCGFTLTGITRENGIMDQDNSAVKLARIEAVASFSSEERDTFYAQDNNPDFAGTTFGDIEIKIENY